MAEGRSFLSKFAENVAPVIARLPRDVQENRDRERQRTRQNFSDMMKFEQLQMAKAKQASAQQSQDIIDETRSTQLEGVKQFKEGIDAHSFEQGIPTKVGGRGIIQSDSVGPQSPAPGTGVGDILGGAAVGGIPQGLARDAVRGQGLDVPTGLQTQKALNFEQRLSLAETEEDRQQIFKDQRELVLARTAPKSITKKDPFGRTGNKVVDDGVKAVILKALAAGKKADLDIPADGMTPEVLLEWIEEALEDEDIDASQFQGFFDDIVKLREFGSIIGDNSGATSDATGLEDVALAEALARAEAALQKGKKGKK